MDFFHSSFNFKKEINMSHLSMKERPTRGKMHWEFLANRLQPEEIWAPGVPQLSLKRPALQISPAKK